MPKHKPGFVDFKAIKASVTMEQVLDKYQLLGTFKRSNNNLSGPCPIHKGTNRTQFRVSLDKQIWNCFSGCKHGGNVLDFVSKMENIDVHKAAHKLIEWFGLDTEAVTRDHEEDDPPEPAAKSVPESKPAPATIVPNPPLHFRLDKLSRSHPYLAERGLTLETLIEFGAGYCEKGMMAGRIAIPIHNPKGEVVAYAGRFIGVPSDDAPKYKLPPGFLKSLEVYNIDLARKEPAEKPLVIVEGFFDVMKFSQNGHRKTVGLMGSTMSEAQEALIRALLTPKSHVIVMLDEDKAGKAERDGIAVRLARCAFVKVHVFGKEDMKPEHLTAQEMAHIVGA